ncbi:non-ribosomal peptide synthase/polyketide synthase [Flavivirga jejuensis]|uniref:Non-ribosomal peptide synthase/polyketide synthase n=1 Tax=Flavivirga jejuensis TaxID=870487 RepID=A0ABT8WKC8_9FLAO|nr:non-ribosomal peptide synthase/polyketide synthase [Flavivirga jejuensis]MDO5973609.1 non-ribosomal peptide synthase/polyketide synthase [Flavivirga jejuensis]
MLRTNLSVSKEIFEDKTLVKILEHHVTHTPNKILYRFLENGEEETDSRTYLELYDRATIIASHILEYVKPGNRVLLLYPSGLDFMDAFFGCLLAGVIAVPAFPPQGKRRIGRLEKIVEDCNAMLVLTEEVVYIKNKKWASKEVFSEIKWLETDKLEQKILKDFPDIIPETVAFLQYTSGSTGNPKGVIIDHANVIDNSELFKKCFKNTPDSVGISWLPIYHDMGLIGNIIQAFYVGFELVMMPPTAFVQKPIRWLQAFSNYKGTISCGPNFAYDLCVNQIQKDDLEGIDLSSWRVAINGSEPIRPETFEKFIARYRDYGLREEALFPGYGLAEATLVVSGCLFHTAPVILGLDKKAFSDKEVKIAKKSIETNEVHRIMGNGPVIEGLTVKIVDPDTKKRCDENKIGEVWVSGASVAKGYWQKEAISKEVFQAYIKGGKKTEGPYLRTGDMGFIHNDDLYISGRLKEMMIINGVNHFPQDIERTVQKSSSDLQNNAGVALSISHKGSQQLVIVQEIKRTSILKYDFSIIVKNICDTVYYTHNLLVYGIVLVSPGRIPKTSSGKIQRVATASFYKENTVDGVLERWDSNEANKIQKSNKATEEKAVSLINTPVEKWFKKIIAEQLELSLDQVSLDKSFTELGINSLFGVRLSGMLSEYLNRPFAPTLIFEFPTLRACISSVEKELELEEGNQVEKLSLSHINRKQYKNKIPASFQQKSLWFLDQLGGSEEYHVYKTIKVSGVLDLNILEKVATQLVSRHEVFKTVMFADENGNLFQKLLDEKLFKIRCFNEHDPVCIDQTIQEVVFNPFNLSKDFSFRCAIIEINKEESILIFVIHHIAADGFSEAILLNDFTRLYNAYSKGNEPELIPLQIQYSEYAIWQKNYLKGTFLSNILDYWEERLRGVLPLNLPYDFSSPYPIERKGKTLVFTLDKTLKASLKELAKEEGVTLFMTLLSVFKVLLFRYCGQSDICVGTPIANRHQYELEKLIGYFVNMLAMRNELDSKATFKEVLYQIKQTSLDAYKNQSAPFEEVVKRVAPRRETGISPIYQVIFALQESFDLKKMNLGGLDCVPYQIANATCKYDITCIVDEKGDGLSMILEYDTNRFREETMQRMVLHYENLLHSVIENRDQFITALSMLSGTETQQVLHEFNNTIVAYPKEKTVGSLFIEQAMSTPNAIAVIGDQYNLSYKKLDEVSNQLANYLLNSCDVVSGDFIGITLDRTEWLIVSMLAILKIGAVYVPIDPKYPEARKHYIAKDSNCKLTINTTIIENFKTIKETCSAIFSAPIYASESLAYVLYTSGSTGNPKGVMITHKSIVRLSKSCDYVSLNTDTVWLSTGSISFDATTIEFWGTLLNGGKLIITDTYKLLNTTYLKSTIQKNNVNTLWMTASWFHQVAEEDGTVFDNISNLLVGGDKVLFKYTNKIFREYPNIVIINGYGPTENTTFSTTYTITDIEEKDVPIGKPINNSQAYVFDETLTSLQPIGIIGELCVGGDGLAKGYLNEEALTREKFIPNPFVKGAQMYRTGDLVRWLPDGNLEFVGRKDDQVKIRGYRVELGEIENVLSSVTGIINCCVLAKQDITTNKRLVGYIVKEDVILEKEEIQQQLALELADYMIPKLWVVLDEMPLTKNGKTDRNALPDPEMSQLTTKEYVSPKNEKQKHLVGIWKQLLSVIQIGIHDNFFELGGDSIITIQVVSRMKRLGYLLQPKDVFEYQTIEELSEVVTLEKGQIEGEQGVLEGICDLLPIQTWYFEDIYVAKEHFNQSLFLTIDKSVEDSHLLAAVQALIQYHDALRFQYKKEKNNWKQEYRASQGEITVHDFQFAVSEEELSELITDCYDRCQKKLSDTEDGVFKVILIKTPITQEKNRVLLVAHHLVVDGVSWRILMEDLGVLLDALHQGIKMDLGVKGSSFRQWVEVMKQYANSDVLLTQLPYWQKVISDFKPLNPDSTSIISQQKDVDTYHSVLGTKHTVSLLKEVHNCYGTEIEDILLSCLGLTISKWTKRDTVIIGLEGHGRENLSRTIDTTNTVGWFTSLYPVSLSVPQEISLGNLIKSVKEQLRNIPDKGMGYGALRYLNHSEQIREKLIGKHWDIVFNYLGQLDTIFKSSNKFGQAGDRIGEAEVGRNTPFHNSLVINSSITAGALVISWEYSRLEFNQSSIVELAAAYQQTLEMLIEHCCDDKEKEMTPSDFGLEKELTYTEFDAFTSILKNKKIAIQSIYKLSPLQEGMLFHGLYDTIAGSYIVQLGLHFKKEVKVDIVRSSWNYLIKNHSILRTGFFYKELSVPVQLVESEVQIPITELDVSSYTDEEQEKMIASFLKEDREVGFEFDTFPLIRITLIKTAPTSQRMIFTNHHILLDGWSMSVLIQEFIEAYTSLLKGEILPDRKEDLYEDYIQYITNKNTSQEEAFWKTYIKELSTPTVLPFTKGIVSGNKSNGNYEESILSIDTVLTKAILSYAKSNHLTANTIFQGVWAMLLSRYTSEKEVAYGVTVSGRPTDLEDSEQRVGLYINTIPLCTSLNADDEILEWLIALQLNHTACREYQYTSLATIQRLSQIKGDLFDTVFVFENYPISEALKKADDLLEIDTIQVKEQTNYPLAIAVTLDKKMFNMKFIHNTSIINESIVKQIQGHFIEVLKQLVQLPVSTTFRDISIVTSKEKRILLEDYNDTIIKEDEEENVVSLFKKQVEKKPNATAIVHEGKVLTYQELDEQSNQLANYLITECGVEEENFVGVMLGRSEWLIISFLAILKSGGTYIPIDPNYPEDRIKYIENDSQCKITIEDTLLLDFRNKKEEYSKNCDSLSIYPQMLAYIIYTSGSTGQPKGVMITHRGIVNTIMSQVRLFNQETTIHCLQFANQSFDASIWEILIALFSGSSLFIIGESIKKDIRLFVEFIKANRITWATLPPAYLKLLNIEELEGIDTLITAGEEAPILKAKEFAEVGNYSNAYGPTETSICATVFNGEIHDNISIGKPIANTRIYILTEDLHLQPQGIIGELCVAGIGVAKGYLNKESLTKEKFVTDPFSSGWPMYRTGDLARWLPDGNIEFVGRKDDQVKIRGHRIELGEIECALAKMATVNSCCVIAKSDEQGTKYLVGYLVIEGKFDRKKIQEELKNTLPGYMVPRIWSVLNTMPITSNGKIDKTKLPNEVDITRSLLEYVAPRNKIEEQLVQIWELLLTVKKVGIHDDFFDLGGHSLLATRLVSIIRQEIKVEISIRDVFSYTVLSELALFISANSLKELMPPIIPIKDKEHIPLSFSQERLWFLDQMKGSTAYHMPLVFRFEGAIDKQVVEACFKEIVSRHEILRTVIETEEGIGYQKVISEREWSMEHLVLETHELEKELAEFTARPFDLQKDYMLRMCLYEVGVDSWVLVGVFHHIASDGWSNTVFIREFITIYENYSKGKPWGLAPLPLQYADYAVWERNYIQGEVLEKQLAYWEQQLNSVTPLSLPYDYVRPSEQSTEGASMRFSLDNKITTDLKEICKEEGVTLFMLLLSVFKILLYRYSHQDDICVGTPIANRIQKESEDLIGFFANTLALRTDFSKELTFREVLQQVKETTLVAYNHQQLPFEKVVEHVTTNRDTSMTPLFQVLFVLQNMSGQKELKTNDFEISSYDYDSTTSKFDITLMAMEEADGIFLGVEYCVDLFKEQTIRGMLLHYNELLHCMVDNIDQKVSVTSLLTPTEEHQLLHVFNKVSIAYPKDKNLLDLISYQVMLAPDAIAVTLDKEQVSYRELDNRSNQLAHYLIERGVSSNDLVGICIERSVEMIIGILGILKSGGAYVPIDPEYPEDRITYIIEDADLQLIVTTTFGSRKLKNKEHDLVLLDKDKEHIAKEVSTLVKRKIKITDTAYVIYTSGSTGNPKGVLISHENVVRLFKNDAALFDFNKNDVWTLFHSFCFDFSVWEIFGALLFGGRLVIVPKMITKDTIAYSKLLKKEQVTVLNQTPKSFYNLQEEVLQELSDVVLRYVIFGGEALNPLKLQQWKKELPNCKLINMYGITETTVHVTYKEITGADVLKTTSTIGNAIPTLSCYILDDALQLVPIGVVGEICVSGAGLSKGYLNRKTLTNEKFVSNPFEPGERLYRSGDIGRWLADGTIEYIGRKDDQVKIRGYRIELGEIESVLSEMEAIRNCCVLAKTDSEGIAFLLGYVVVNNDFEKEEIKENLRKRLPEYMIPELWVFLDEMPLTSNGKINKKKLPNPDNARRSSKEYVAADNPTQKQLVAIWEEILEVDKIGIYDNFFELGGHSLLATRLVSLIRKRMKTELAIRDIFSRPTIIELGKYLINASKSIMPVIKSRSSNEKLPLSFSQERLWFIDQLEGSLNYHMPVSLYLEGALDIVALEGALKMIVSRHEILRTVINEEDGIGYQVVRATENWSLKKVTVEDHELLENQISEFIATPFDLSNDYMLRMCLFQLESESFELVGVLHHIASDGWSNSILVNELKTIYKALKRNQEIVLLPLPIQYADYAIWQRTYIDGIVLEQQLQYWQNQLQGIIPLMLPFDYLRPSLQSKQGANFSFLLDEELSTALNDFAKEEGVTLFMVLLSVFKVLLYRYSGQEDICVGTPIANRTQKETENLIGFFVNTLVLRSDLRGNPSFRMLLEKVKATTLEAYDYQLAPFEKVVDRVIESRDMSMSPLFQVLFVLQNTPEMGEIQLEDVSVYKDEVEINSSNYDLTLLVEEKGSRIVLDITYCSDLFTERTIKRIANHYKKLVSACIARPEVGIANASMLSETEEEDLLIASNNIQTVSSQETLVSLFAKQLTKTPNEVAVVFGEQEWTFFELDNISNKIANYLVSEYGITTEDFVGVKLERSNWLIGILLAIQKLGAVYIPIDPEYPKERIAYIEKDSNCSIVIDTEFLKKYDQISNHIHTNIPKIEVKKHMLSYVIYTSGSTGKPKGVMIEHEGIVNTIVSQITAFHILEKEACLQFANQSFDASISEIFVSLLAGAKLVIIEEAYKSDKDYFVDFIKKHSISWATIPPAFLEIIAIDDLKGIKTLVTAGEQAPLAKVKEFSKYGIYCNAYGPTETSICATIFEGEIDTNVPIGRPIHNTKVYVLSDELELQPQGIIGELCVAGKGLARGYLNQEELTAKAFVENPFVEGERMYRTGDLVRMQFNGNIEFIGRKDDQVKIRGYRIELGEIAHVIAAETYIDSCSVIVKKDKKGNSFLVSYVVATRGIEVLDIKEQLASKLPDYMIPQFWVFLDEMPITSNGKVDKKALPDFNHNEDITSLYTEARNETEEQLVAIWQELLEREKVGVIDDFFDLGGHSLLATRMVSIIRKEMLKEVTIRDIFTYPTIARLSFYISTQNKQEHFPRIVPQQREGQLPLSFSQERLWFIDQLEGTLDYNMPVVLKLTGVLDIQFLEDALKEIVQRHEILRTVIKTEDGKGYQEVRAADTWSLDTVEALVLENQEQLIHEFVSKPFDLSQDFMLRMRLYEVDENEYILAGAFHHIATDGWSNSILIKELITLYDGYKNGKINPLTPLSIQYADYAIWQRNYIEGTVLEKQLAYWNQKLRGVSSLVLPLDFPRPAIQSTKGNSFTFSLDTELSNSLDIICKEEEVTLFMLLLAAFKILLYKYSGQKDICVGSPIANRTREESEALIGFFVNTLALRSDLSGNPSISDILQQVKENTLEAYEHQQAPFEKVVDSVVEVRDRSMSPLFQVMFVLQNTPQEAINLEGLTITNMPYEVDNSKYDITLAAIENESGILLNMTYCTDLFREDTIRQMAEHYKMLLYHLIENTKEYIGNVTMITASEKHQLLTVFNETKLDYPHQTTVLDLFYKQVENTPDAIAVVFQDTALTYIELDKKTNQLARYLQKQGVKENSLVGICIGRSLEMIVGILGILKAKGTYVPIDPDYPEDRIAYILEDAEICFVISSAIHIELWKDKKAIELTLLDTDWNKIEAESSDRIPQFLSPEYLAYIIYTSGSTGNPKGVMVTHANLTGLAFSKIAYYGSVEGMLLLPSFVFDPSVSVIFGTLLTGGRLIIPSKEAIHDASQMKKLLQQNVDLLLCVSSYYNFLLNEEVLNNTQLRGVIVGGEKLNKKVVEKHYELYRSVAMYNEYGPTECTVWASVSKVQENEVIDIGCPVSNTQIYILDEQQQLVPRGVVGELCISGVGLSNGYLNREELTKEKFVPNPFVAGKRMYRTGDLARWLPDGRIAFVGRTDDQVKIRGYRIELGEIETALLKVADIESCCVIVKEDAQETKQLVGYVVVEGEFDMKAVKQELKLSLPEYMIPVLWMPLEIMPLTSNGKIDKKALPDLDMSLSLKESYVAPRNELEKQIAIVWQELLGVSEIGVHDNFFELGGDSIITIQVVSRMSRIGYAIQPRDLFEYQTISGLTSYIASGIGEIIGEQGFLTGQSDLLPIQQWYFDEIYSEGAHFNQAVLLAISKDINEASLRKTLEVLTTHHDALRFMYEQKGAQWIQTYGDKVSVVEVVDWNTVVETEEAFCETSITVICEHYQKRLSSHKEQLFTVVLIKTPCHIHDDRLFLLANHLIIDGVSWRILLDDFGRILKKTETTQETEVDLGKKGSSYREWVQALKAYTNKNSVLAQQSYWSSMSMDYMPIPTDLKGEVSNRNDVANYKNTLDTENTTALLKEIHQSYGTEIEDILISCLVMTIHGWSGKNKVMIGLEGHGREDISDEVDVSNTIGWFTNVYPVSLIDESKGALGNLIKSIKEQLRKIPDKGLGYGALLNLHPSEEVRKRISKIQWDILFNYLGQLDNLTTNESWFDIALESCGTPIGDSIPFTNKLEINSSVTGGQLQLEWSYSEKEYKPETIKKLANQYLSNIKTIINHCKNQKNRDFTPSDYGLEKEIEITELDAFFEGETTSDSEEIFKI